MADNRELALTEARARALEKISDIDLEERFTLRGIGWKKSTAALHFSAFGHDLSLSTEDFTITDRTTKSGVNRVEDILILHYLSGDTGLKETGSLISFRELPGGNFYYSPFMSRTVKPLIARTGNDIDRLKQGLKRYNWSPGDMGDFSVKIHVMGNIYIYLIYWLGDSEFGPSADVLFDSCIKQAFSTEDAVAMASRICLSLI
jgi:hypothetical protein